MTELGRFLFVRLKPDLSNGVKDGTFSNIKLLPAVELVCDLSVVSRETLDGVLLPPEQTIKPRRRPNPRLSNPIYEGRLL